MELITGSLIFWEVFFHIWFQMYDGNLTCLNHYQEEKFSCFIPTEPYEYKIYADENLIRNINEIEIMIYLFNETLNQEGINYIFNGTLNQSNLCYYNKTQFEKQDKKWRLMIE